MRPSCPDGIGPRAGVNSTTCRHATFNHQPISPTPPTDPAASGLVCKIDITASGDTYQQQKRQVRQTIFLKNIGTYAFDMQGI